MDLNGRFPVIDDVLDPFSFGFVSPLICGLSSCLWSLLVSVFCRLSSLL